MCLTKTGTGTIALNLSEAPRRRRSTTRLSAIGRMAPSSIPSSNFSIISDNERDDDELTSAPTKVVVEREYHDHAYERDQCGENGEGSKRRGPRGGVAHPFPEKLHIMLEAVAKDGLEHIVSWHPHGRSFAVHKPKEFVAQIMPRFFKQTKLTSFQRQLNLYGFCRLTAGNDRGGYYHELFLRDRQFLCDRMMRTRIKGTGTKSAMSPETEPDFYSMPSVKPLSQTPRQPPTKTTWKVTYEQKVTKKQDVKKQDVKKQPPAKQLHRRVSLAMEEDDLKPPPKPQNVESFFEPPMVQSSDPTPPFPKPASYPSMLPLVMPVLPMSTAGVEEASSPVITPPSTPMQEDDIPPPPPEMPDNWMLSDSAMPLTEPLVFEGKTFHYLDACSFDCLHEDRGADQEWGFSMKDADEFLAGM